MLNSDVIKLAKQGNIEAISLLLNQNLQAKNITAIVDFYDDGLQVKLESPQLLNQEYLVSGLRLFFTNLAIELVKNIKVYGWTTGKDFPDWSEDIAINPSEQAKSNEYLSNYSFPPKSDSSNSSQAPKVTDTFKYYSSQEESYRPPCPRTYLIPSILITLFAFMPVGIVAIIFAAQVKSKYEYGDYDGAESASNTAKLMCIIGTVIAVPGYLIFLFAIVSMMSTVSFVDNSVNKAKQAEAKYYLGTILGGQKTFYTKNQKFSSKLSDLRLDIPLKTSSYSYEIKAEETNAIITATALTDEISSFTGAIFVISTKSGSKDKKITITEICESNEPSKIAPDTPKLVNNKIVCAAGSISFTAKPKSNTSLPPF
ncbi:MAG TPA: type IV pilin-like G/H family protein [Nostocaceae cyanobacterium]|nr:type IV pilin-like G/H family protein [Nostocaceae cyanobacterium]